MADTTDIKKDTKFTTSTENAADFGFPPPSSFPTLTLHLQITVIFGVTQCQILKFGV